MKGFIFTNFLDFVEKSHGLEMVDEMILNTNIASGGVYSAFNSYDYNELITLLTYFSKKTEIKEVVLLEKFGKFVFPYLICKHAYIAQNYSKPLDFLASIENHIHIEVKKIYNDADLPTFKIKNRTDNKLTLIYKSSRGLTYFAIGLIKESLNHFDVKGSVIIDDSYDKNEGVKLDIQLLT
jgi:hypothetical protein